jgi:hypothetical protein
MKANLPTSREQIASFHPQKNFTGVIAAIARQYTCVFLHAKAAPTGFFLPKEVRPLTQKVVCQLTLLYLLSLYNVIVPR